MQLALSVHALNSITWTSVQAMHSMRLLLQSQRLPEQPCRKVARMLHDHHCVNQAYATALLALCLLKLPCLHCALVLHSNAFGFAKNAAGLQTGSLLAWSGGRQTAVAS